MRDGLKGLGAMNCSLCWEWKINFISNPQRWERQYNCHIHAWWIWDSDMLKDFSKVTKYREELAELSLHLNTLAWSPFPGPTPSFCSPILHWLADPSSYCYFLGVMIWELGHKESWAPKNWCFWTVVLEKALESPLDCKDIKPGIPKGNQHWIFIGRTDAEAAAPVLWPADVKSRLVKKDHNAVKD